VPVSVCEVVLPPPKFSLLTKLAYSTCALPPLSFRRISVRYTSQPPPPDSFRTALFEAFFSFFRILFVSFLVFLLRRGSSPVFPPLMCPSIFGSSGWTSTLESLTKRTHHPLMPCPALFCLSKLFPPPLETNPPGKVVASLCAPPSPCQFRSFSRHYPGGPFAESPLPFGGRWNSLLFLPHVSGTAPYPRLRSISYPVFDTLPRTMGSRSALYTVQDAKTFPCARHSGPAFRFLLECVVLFALEEWDCHVALDCLIILCHAPFLPVVRMFFPSRTPNVSSLRPCVTQSVYFLS